MNRNFKKGFTLIELLVVIAIIGILSAVVLASLNTARDKGADAAVRSNLNNIRAQAELYYDENGLTYNGVCATGSKVDSMVAAANVANGAAATAACGDGNLRWAVEAQFKTSTDFLCIDSLGNSATTSATSITAGTGQVDDASDCVCGDVADPAEDNCG
jgi:prepilin-type N-terminal cleavage/methylation domain-containing protein